MPPATDSSDAFLSGQGIPVALANVDEELARLWGPAADREGGPDQERPTVTRLVLANLVVADLASDGSRTRELLELVARHYPCREIMLRHSDDPAREVRAEVSAVCHLPAPGLPQVCSEQIILSAGPQTLDLLPGAVRPLLETDLPLVLWWVGDPRPHRALFLDLADESSRLILDQPDPQPDVDALRTALDLSVNRFGRDLVWFGITPWRELVAGFFDPPGAESALERLTSVRIEAVARPGDPTPRVALWLAAWLAGRLGWAPKTRLGEDAQVLAAVFDGPGGGIGVEFRTRRDPDVAMPHLLGVTLEAGSRESYRAVRANSAEVRLVVRGPGHDPLPRLIRVMEWDAVRRLAAALESARDDPPYRDALPVLLWLLGRDDA
jgi:glucose-6-phosphate dehydrogenase assembly protein OpcA